jgi:predicted dehydrogenase
MNRREFIAAAGSAVTAASLSSSAFGAEPKLKIALVGTGIRGSGFWGRDVQRKFGDKVEFVGLCDNNPGRLEYAKGYIGGNCPTFTNFDQMMKTQKPELLIVTTPDALHHKYIVRGLELGADVFTEKPMTTDELKCQAILDAERSTGRKVMVGFNYRYGTHFTRLKELLVEGRIGRVTSVDFHWYLNTDHGASYFRRWHGLREMSGTLLVHKATHHFDLLNWFIDSDPVEVHAYGDLEFYGRNNPFRSEKCRGCPHKDKCRFFWDITTSKRDTELYVNNEQYDGYIRDACLWRPQVNIFDKMAVQIKYANNVQVSYSLTTYSPFEGWKIAFNGTNGRLESWDDIPWFSDREISQEELHAIEMSQSGEFSKKDLEGEAIVMENFSKYDRILIPKSRGGHGGGDIHIHNRVFVDPNAPDPLHHAAGSRDGAMSVLIGIAARKSIDEQRAVKIAELTDLEPQEVRVKVS